MRTNIAARDIKPGMKYLGREIAVTYLSPSEGTMTIAVVCPPHLPRIGDDHPVYGPTGKFTWPIDANVEIER